MLCWTLPGLVGGGLVGVEEVGVSLSTRGAGSQQPAQGCERERMRTFTQLAADSHTCQAG